MIATVSYSFSHSILNKPNAFNQKLEFTEQTAQKKQTSLARTDTFQTEHTVPWAKSSLSNKTTNFATQHIYLSRQNKNIHLRKTITFQKSWIKSTTFQKTQTSASKQFTFQTKQKSASNTIIIFIRKYINDFIENTKYH